MTNGVVDGLATAAAAFTVEPVTTGEATDDEAGSDGETRLVVVELGIGSDEDEIAVVGWIDRDDEDDATLSKTGGAESNKLLPASPKRLAALTLAPVELVVVVEGPKISLSWSKGPRRAAAAAAAAD